MACCILMHVHRNGRKVKGGRISSSIGTVAATVRRSEKSILTLMIIFRVKINVAIYMEPRNGVKIFKKWVLGMSIFTQNSQMYCIQKNRLCNTVSTKQSINKPYIQE